MFAFQLAYAIGLLIAGRLMDRFGARLGFSLVIVIWSLAAMAHAEASVFGPGVAALLGAIGLTYSGSVAGFIAARFALGLGEAGNFPASIKVVAEWFPKRERAFATGIFNSGTNIGALVTPLVVPVVTITWGWYWAFIATGLLGFFWLVVWWTTYASPGGAPACRRRPSWRTSRATLPTRRSACRGRTLLRYRQTWAFALGKFLTDPVWWLYLFWIPDFLNRNYGINLSRIGPPLIAIYLDCRRGQHRWRLAVLGADQARVDGQCGAQDRDARLRARGRPDHVRVEGRRSVGRGRARGIAASAHQGWSANLYTLVSDTFPRHAVGSVVGFGGAAGAVGGMLIAKVTGYILQATGSYVPVFLMASFAYLLALGVDPDAGAAARAGEAGDVDARRTGGYLRRSGIRRSDGPS